MNYNRNRAKKGFTLVELVIYMGIMSVLLVVMTNAFTSIVDIQLESESVSSVEQDAAYVLARLFYDIPRASSITTPASAGSSGSTLSIVIDGVTHTYALASGVLTLTDAAGTDALTSANTRISSLSFLRLGTVGGKHSIQVAFTLESQTVRAGGETESRSYQTTIGLR